MCAFMLFDKNGYESTDDMMSAEESMYMMEAVMNELSNDELSVFLEDSEAVQDAVNNGILLERTIVRLDKKAKLSKAKKMAIFMIAKEKNDINFKKLQKVWRMERYLEAVLEKKYGNEASRRAKKFVQRKKDKKGVNAMMKTAINKANSQLSTATKVPPKPKEIKVNVPKNVK